jgi:hypothetical protein
MKRRGKWKQKPGAPPECGTETGELNALALLVRSIEETARDVRLAIAEAQQTQTELENRLQEAKHRLEDAWLEVCTSELQAQQRRPVVCSR